MSARRPIAVVVAVIAVVALAGTALGYWTASGSGSGIASVGTLAAPTSVSASPGSATVGQNVSISWTAPAAPSNAASVTYVVERSAGSSWTSAGGDCPASASAAYTSTSCTAVAPATGTYTYRVTANWRSWSAVSSASNTVIVTAPTVIDHFDVSAPASATAGTAFSVTVTAKDSSNATVTGYAGTIHFTSSDLQAVVPADYTFTGADNGSKTFTNAVTLKTAGSRTVNVNDTAQTSKTGTTSVTVNAATASKLAYRVQPTNAVAGASMTPAVQVEIDDQFGNQTSSTASVTVALGANPGSGTLSGTKTAAAVNGIATFGNLSIDKVATGYTLAASSSGLTGATSSTFNITPAAASKLVFTTQPSNTTAGGTITPAVSVAIQDQFGNQTASTANVTVAFGTNAGSGTLAGTKTVAALGGVASFSDLSVDKAGTGYTLAASSSALTGATSSAFNISAAAPAKLAFTTSPSNTTAGATITPAVTIAIQDQFGNATTSASNVTLALNASNGATLGGTLTKAAVSGTATFSDLNITKVGSYTLGATSGSLTPATSSSFNVTAASALKLVFTTAAVTLFSGATSGDLTVERQDQFGNSVTSGGPLTVNLTSTSSPAGSFKTTANAATTTTTIAAGGSTGSFRYVDTAFGTPTITASAGTLTSATQQETVYNSAVAGLGFANITSNGVTATNVNCGGTIGVDYNCTVTTGPSSGARTVTANVTFINASAARTPFSNLAQTISWSSPSESPSSGSVTVAGSANISTQTLTAMRPANGTAQATVTFSVPGSGATWTGTLKVTG